MGLLHILPRLGKSGGHIPHSSPFSYSRRLSPFPPFPPSSSRRSRGLLLPALGRGEGMGPSQGNFWRSGQLRRRWTRPRSRGGRHWLTMRSGIQHTAAAARRAPRRGADSGNTVCVCVCVLPLCLCCRLRAAEGRFGQDLRELSSTRGGCRSDF